MPVGGRIQTSEGCLGSLAARTARSGAAMARAWAAAWVKASRSLDGASGVKHHRPSEVLRRRRPQDSWPEGTLEGLSYNSPSTARKRTQVLDAGQLWDRKRCDPADLVCKYPTHYRHTPQRNKGTTTPRRTRTILLAPRCPSPVGSHSHSHRPADQNAGLDDWTSSADCQRTRRTS